VKSPIPKNLAIEGATNRLIYKIKEHGKARRRRRIPDCPGLIEVALPIRELSDGSIRDKGIQQNQISRLHKWGASRLLAISRAVVLASPWGG
jgi:hypothetical protein